jgi:endonuclease YncB( thermonuclease family)
LLQKAAMENVMKTINYLFSMGVAAVAVAVAEMSAAVVAKNKSEPAAQLCIRPEAIDGDTIRCGRRGYRVSHRLLGIDAPELAGHCRKDRECAPGDPLASRAALATAIKGGATVQSFGEDIYKRRLSIVRTKGGSNASCLQITGGQAIFKPKWDKGGRIKRECV